MSDAAAPAVTMRWAGRLAALDVARGAAIVAMILFHTIWDLGNFGYIERAIPYSFGVKLFGHAIGIAFLFIVGVSLMLARERSADWAPFWRRLARVTGAAGLVSLGTYVVFPQGFVYFGILHCIALSSLLAAPLLSQRWPAVLAAAIAAILAPMIFAAPLFDVPWLSWIGLSTYEPITNDWRPLLPWAGVVFLGLAAAKFWRKRGFAPIWADFEPGALSFLGRHSLAIYLLHQPALFAVFYGLAAMGLPARDADASAFVTACEERCVQSDVDAAICHAACVCTAQRAASLTREETLDPEKRASRLDEIARGCVSGAQ